MIINKFPGQDENSDKTFVTKDTTLEITTESGKKSTKKASELTDEERDIFNSRGYNALGGNRVYDDLTDETRKLRSAWEEAPTVKIENGKLKISGSAEFLKSNEAKQLRDVMKQMKGNYYNTEDLNKQIEAWNSVLAKMSDEYVKMINATNAANASISETAKNPQHHVFTLQDTQKIGNSARIGKQADARTTKNKIFVGYEWDDNGKMVEKWVEAKDFFNEINKIPNEEKRNYIRDLNTKAANGDVGAYSKLMYIQGGSEGMPTNIDYDQTDDFWKTFGENALVQLGEFADFVTTYVPIFNLPRVTSRAVNAFQKGDINAFFESDYTRKMLDDYSEVVSWENAYFSQLTPGSTRLAAGTGNLTGYALGMAFSIWAGGVGNQAAAAVTSNAIASANNALRATGKFTEFSRITTGFGRPTLTNGALPSGLSETFAASSSARVLLPTALVQKFPNFARFLATSALNVMQYAGIGEGITGTIKDPNLIERGFKIGPQVNIHSGFGGTMADVFGTGDRVVTVTENSMVMPDARQKLSSTGAFPFGTKQYASTSFGTNLLPQGLKVEQFNNGIAVSGRTIKAFSETSTALNKTISSGLQTALRLVPLAGESALRHTDRYLQGVNAGKDMGDMGEYIATNTAHDVIVGGAFIGAGAMIRKLRGISSAARVSPSRVTEEAFNVTNQSEWFSNGHFTYDNGSSYLAPASLATDTELQDFVARVMTVNGESLFISPNRTPVASGYEGITTDFTVDSAGGVAPSGVTTVHPTTIEFAPVPDTAAKDTGQAFGFASSNRITKLTVEPGDGGGYLVKTEYNVDTGTTTETREFYANIDEAVAEVKKQSVPKASPRTVANSDALEDANVAPLSIDGQSTATPEGVTKVQVRPDIVYRSPEAIVEDVINIATQGYDAASAAQIEQSIRDTFSAYVSDMDDKNNMLSQWSPVDAPLYPTKESVFDLIDSGGILKVAAWAYNNGYDLVPLKVPSKTQYVKVGSRNVKMFVNTPAYHYELPEYNPTNFIYSSDNDHNYINDSKAMWYALGYMPKEFNIVNVNRIPTIKKIVGKERFNVSMGMALVDFLARLDAGTGSVTDLPYALKDNLPNYSIYIPIEEFLTRYMFGAKYAVGNRIIEGSIGHLPDNVYDGSLLQRVKEKYPADSESLHPKVRKLLSELYDAYDKYQPAAQKWFDNFNTAERMAEAPLTEESSKDIAEAADKLMWDYFNARKQANSRASTDEVLSYVKKEGKPLTHPIYVAARLKDGVATFNPESLDDTRTADLYTDVDVSDTVPESEKDIYTGEKGDFAFIHLPAGTKIGVVLMPGEEYSDYSRRNWVADLTPGVTKEGGEYYLNYPNGAKYRPDKKEYDPSIYFLHQERMSPGGHRYEQWEKDYLDVNPEVEGIQAFYEIVSPGGSINDLNSELRKKKYAGKIPSDSLVRRVNDVISEIDRVVNSSDKRTISYDKLLSLIQRNLIYGASYNPYDSQKVTFDMQENKEYHKFMTNLRDEFTKIMSEKAEEYYAQLISDGRELSRDYFDAHYRQYTPVPEEVSQWVIKNLLDAVAKFGDKISKEVLDEFVDIDTLGRLGTQTVKEGTMPWVKRGLGIGSNFFNSSNEVYHPINEWKVGQPIDANSIDFWSINPANPFQPIYQPGYGSDNYVISLGLMPGVKVFSYADINKNFHMRQDDHYSLHRGDGGALTLAYGTRITPVSIRKEKNGPVHIIAIATPAGEDYTGPIDKEGYTELKRVPYRQDEVIEELNKFLVTQYGAPEKWFPTKEEALKYAEDMGERAVYEIDDSSDTLERPPVTMDVFKALEAGQPVLKLTAGGHPTEALQRFNDLMVALTTLESPEDYTRGIIDIVHQVQAIYNQVALNVNLDLVYESYGKAIAEGKEPEALSVEMEALRPLLQVLDALGHYFDPSGKSLTQKFYLPTMLKPNKKVNIEDAILGKDDVVDPESPVDGGLDDILLDPTRVGDSGFWQQRSGDLFRDADGNFTMDKAAPLEDAVISYTVSALTRGKNKLYVAAQNEVARSKFDRNRAQITSKQAMAGLKDADTLRTKAKAIQANIVKDAEALAEIKENYSGEESTIDKALEEKNYAAELNYTTSVNTMAQKLGFNQFMQMNNIPGSALRFGANATGFRGIANIRRKLEKINVTGTMWVNRYGEKVNIGFGLEPTPANHQAYGDFKPDKAVNLGQVVGLHFDADRAAKAFLDVMLNNALDKWSGGDGWDLMSAISNFTIENFPLVTNYELYTADLMKKLAQNYNKYKDPKEVYLANVAEISAWIRRGTLTTFNNAIKMSNISNLDERTIRALDEAAATMLIGSPVQRAKTINAAQELAVWAALGGNFRVTPGNALQEPLRLIDVVGYKGFAKAWKTALNPKEAARINNLLDDLPSRFSETEMVGLANKAKSTFGKLKEKASHVVLSPLEKSEQFKNILFWAAAEDNAKAKYPGDPVKQLQETLRFFNDYAIAGGRGTAPGVATSSAGRLINIFKTFSIRNFDDFIDYVEKVSRGESGNNYWDKKYEKRHGGGGSDDGGGSDAGKKAYKDRSGRNKFDPRIAIRVVGGRVLRSYLFWLLVGSYIGKSFFDSLGGDPSGITEGGFDRGLYDDPDTEEYEGMTGFDDFVNSLPAGFILGALQDLYFAARRRGIEQHQFFGFDIGNDERFAKSLQSKLPLGVAKNRFSDMLDLVDRGYSFSSTGRKTYAAPESALDTLKGFLFGKATTQNSLAYGKYRYGMIDIWGDLSSGDWMDFAMNANPFSDNAKFDTTRKDYTGVFNGSWNDISTMQLIIQQFRERNKQIIADFQENKYRFRGDYEGLSDEEKVAKAKEQRDKDIAAFTDDVTRAVDAFEKAGNTLNDNQITNIMYLFDFHEGEEDDEWNSSYARKRYVEAGLPDYNAGAITRGTKTVDGEKQEVTKNILDRSLVLQNAQQGYYGSSKEAANAVKDALRDFKPTYQQYNKRVKELNNKYFAARNRSKNSAETKQLSKELESLQNEYLDKLFDKLAPVMSEYGTALVGTYDVADVLEDYMGNMIPYSSIRKYGQTYSSGNDIVYGQLTEWLQKRLGRNAPTAASDKEVTNGIADIKKLLDQGKTSAARSKARAILEKIGRGSLGARNYDVETLRGYAYD